jgi:two-component system sensor histidine kinase KdpD
LLDSHRALLGELGARYVEVTGTDVAEALVRFAVAENATQIILGSSNRSRLSEVFRGSVINRVIELVDGIDVHVISTSASAADPSDARRRSTVREPSPHSARSRLFAWLVALVGTPLLGLVLIPSDDHLGISATLLVLLLGPVVAAVLGGPRPAIVAAITGFVAIDVLYVTPRISLRIAQPSELVTLVVFVAVAVLVSVLVDRLARQTIAVARQRVETQALAQLAGSTAILDADALDRLVGELRVTLGLDAVAVLAAADDPTGAAATGWRVEAAAGEPVPTTPEAGTYSAELADGATLVVVGPTLPAADRGLLSAFVAQVRLAQAALGLTAAATRAEALAEANDLRDALLAAVSHDLRAPLANIKAAATSLTSADVTWSANDIDGFARTIDAEADRLTTLVVNLLDMSRLQTGMLGVRLAPCASADVVYAALASLSGDTSSAKVVAADDLPLMSTDPALMERAVANIIRNALDWSPPGSEVRVEAAAVHDRIDIRVIDRGTGIPRDQRDAVFRPFQRLGDGGQAAMQGIGLGLAVAQGFCLALGASIVIDDTPGGGTTVTISVPAADTSPPAASLLPTASSLGTVVP